MTQKFAIWGGAAVLFLAAVLAQWSGHANWGPMDFVIFGGLLVGAVLTFEGIVRSQRDPAFQVGIGLTLMTAFFVIWANLSLGIIGSDAQPLNGIYFAGLALAALGCGLVRFRPQGLMWILVALAAGQILLAVAVPILIQRSSEMPSMPSLWMVSGLFCILWLTAAWFFRKSSLSKPQTRKK